jgi:hypothetical protein
MAGFLVAMSILIGTLIVFAIAYKKRTGRNFFKDLFDDMCGR